MNMKHGSNHEMGKTEGVAEKPDSAPLSTINLTQDGLGSFQIPVVSNQ
jgi:hypothetical protein